MIDLHGLSVTDAAAKQRVTRQAMRNLLGSCAGLSADTRRRMQAAHDLAFVRARGGEIEVERVAA